MTATDPGLSLDVFAKFGLSLDRISAQQAKTNELLARPAQQPFTFEQTKDLVMPPVATFPAFIGLGGPQQGFIWECRNLVIAGLSVDTVVAGTAYVFVRGMTPPVGITQAQWGVTGLRDIATSLPLPAFYGRGQVTIRANQKLWVMLLNYTTSTDYVASAEIEQYQDQTAATVVAT